MTIHRRSRHKDVSSFYWLRAWLFLPCFEIMTPRQIRRLLRRVVQYSTSEKRISDASKLVLDARIENETIDIADTPVPQFDDAWEDLS